jgi:hypothetical protein
MTKPFKSGNTYTGRKKAIMREKDDSSTSPEER